ncbi:hypothetical protein ACGF3J_04570 [Streptomyces sp. NPDC048171]|nr:hypothetical protein [Streptomyces sp. SID5789]MZE68206.1 hypothetical protein [Streptomyces sp. SID5789]
MLNLAMDTPARGPKRFTRATAHMSDEPADTGPDTITTPTPRPEALPC